MFKKLILLLILIPFSALGQLVNGDILEKGVADLSTDLIGILGVSNGGSGTSTNFTTGSMVFAGGSGIYTQDNASLFFDDSSNEFGIGTAVPIARLDVSGQGAADTPIVRFSGTANDTSSIAIGLELAPDITAAAGNTFQALRVIPSLTGVFTEANVWSMSVAGPTNNGGATTTTAIGLQISQINTAGTTTGYGVFQDSNTDINYFAGLFGIGTAGPDENLHVAEATDGDSVLAIYENSQANAAASLNETAQIRFGFGTNNDVARIVVGKDDDYDPSSTEEDSFLALYTDLNGTSTERFRITSDGDIILEGTGADDANELTLTTSPSADRTFTFPNETGTGITTVSVAGSLADASVLAADLESDLRDMKINFVIEDAVTGDTGDFQQEVPDACTLTEVACNVSSDGTSVTINFYERARATPETGTTEMLTADLVCDTNGAVTTSFTDSALAKDVPFALAIDAVSGAPTWLRVHVKCQR